MKNNQKADSNTLSIITQNMETETINTEGTADMQSQDFSDVMNMIADRYEAIEDFPTDATAWAMTTPELQAIIEAFMGCRPTAAIVRKEMGKLGFKCIFGISPIFQPDFYGLLKKKIF